MHRLIAVAGISSTAAFLAAALAGAPFFSILWIVPVVVSLSLGLWAVSLFIAYNTYRPRADAAAMMEGVCPECRTFNSLEEVTSADPKYRYVDCLACKERLRVQAKDGHFTAERLGKRED